MVRALQIHERLRSGCRINAVTLAEELGMSDRTIKRDIARMRDELGAPITWDVPSHSYQYERPCDLLPLLRLTADEALALVLAARTFSAWGGSALGRAITGALEKIAGVVGGAVSLPGDEISALVFQPDEGAEAEAERRWLAVALEAIQRRRELEITYQKPRAAQPEDRIVHPLHLAFLDHRCVLIAFDTTRRQPRNFLLTRIRGARATARHFTPPAGFSLKKYLAGSMGRFTGEKDIEVRIAFDAIVVPYLRETPWHASQELTDRPDGRVEAAFRLNNLIDVQRRVLACGRHAEVLAPAELRAAVQGEIVAMLDHYATGPAPAPSSKAVGPSLAGAPRQFAPGVPTAVPTPIPPIGAKRKGTYSQGHPASHPAR